MQTRQNTQIIHFNKHVVGHLYVRQRLYYYFGTSNQRLINLGTEYCNVRML